MAKLKLIQHMQATENGIIYYYPCATKACMTIIDKSGNIGVKFMPLFKQVIPSTFIEEKAIEEKFSYLKALILDCILIFLAIFSKDSRILSAVTMFSLFISLNLFKIFHVIYEMKISKRLVATSRFVAASHMATNAYRKLQRVPTLEEAKKNSRFSTDSKLNWTLSRISSQFALILFLLLFPEINAFVFIGLATIISLFFMFITPLGIFNFWQTFVTSKPSDKELEVAIIGIKFYEEMKDAKVNFVEK